MNAGTLRSLLQTVEDTIRAWPKAIQRFVMLISTVALVVVYVALVLDLATVYRNGIESGAMASAPH